MSLNLYKCLLEMQLGYASYELFIYCANSRPHQPAFLLFVLSYFSFAKFELFLISVLLLILSPQAKTYFFLSTEVRFCLFKLQRIIANAQSVRSFRGGNAFI